MTNLTGSNLGAGARDGGRMAESQDVTSQRVNLPEGWMLTKLGLIIELKYGKSLPAKKRDGEKYPVFGSNGVVGQHSEPLIKRNGIIVGRKGSYGEVQLSEVPFFPIDTTYFVDEFYNQPIKYWYYQLRDLPLTQLNRSTAIPGLNRDDAYSQKIKLPPLAEQKVIADKLDTLLAQVETTKARLERIPQILKTFRQSVLAAAVSGKLTEEWREQRQTEWPTVQHNLGDLIELVYGKSLPAKTRSGDGYPVYGSNGEVGLHSEFLVEGPFIIVGRKGSYGEVTWSVKNGWPIDTTYFVNLRQVSDLRFVYFLLQTLGLNQLNRSTAIPGLNREDAYGQKVVIPEIKEQTQIVSRVEELFAFADSIEEKANAALERVNNLTQSILAKAFRGELTADWRAANPELISGDNSVEALLEKIKIERDALKKQQKPKRSAVKKNRGSRMSKQITKVVDALKEAGKPLSGQQLLAAAGYPNDSSTDQLEQFFLDIRGALALEKTIIKLERGEDGQDWFALAKTGETSKA